MPPSIERNTDGKFPISFRIILIIFLAQYVLPDALGPNPKIRVPLPEVLFSEKVFIVKYLMSFDHTPVRCFISFALITNLGRPSAVLDSKDAPRARNTYAVELISCWIFA